jgi:hypothetical protein
MTVPIYTKGVTTNCVYHRRISILKLRMILFFNILLPWSPSYVEEIAVEHRCKLQCEKSTTDRVFYIHHIIEKQFGIPRTAKCIKNVGRYIKFMFYFSPNLVSKHFHPGKYLASYRRHIEIYVCLHIKGLFVSFDFNKYLNGTRKFSRTR